MNEGTLQGIEIKSMDIDRQTSATQARYNRIAPLVVRVMGANSVRF